MESRSGRVRSRHSRPGGRWATSDILRVVLLVVAVYLLLQLIWVAQTILLLTFLGILFGLVLAVPVDWLEQRRVPRALGTAIITLGLAGMLTGLGFLVAPRIASQMGQVQDQLPEAIGQVREWFERRQGSVEQLLGDTLTGAQSAEPVAGDAPGGNLLSGLSGSRFFSLFSSTIAIAGGVLLLLFITVYVAADPRLYYDGLIMLVPRGYRRRTREVLHEVGIQLRRWMVTQGIAMLVIGGVTTVVLLLLGVRAALALGIIAGLLEFIPVVGPILSAVPAVGMAFLDSPPKALWVVVAYIGIQQVEGNLLIPLLMKGRIDLPPVVTLLAQAVMALAFGFVGLVVAVPLVATVMVATRVLYVRDVVGEEVSLPGDKKE